MMQTPCEEILNTDVLKPHISINPITTTSPVIDG